MRGTYDLSRRVVHCTDATNRVRVVPEAMKLVGVQCEHRFCPLAHTGLLVLLPRLGRDGCTVDCLITRKFPGVEGWTCRIFELAQGNSERYCSGVEVSEGGFRVESKFGQCVPVSEGKKQVKDDGVVGLFEQAIKDRDRTLWGRQCERF